MADVVVGDVAAADVDGDVAAVLAQLRPGLDADDLRRVLDDGDGPASTCTVARRDGSCVGVAVWHVRASTAKGRVLHVDDLVTAAAARSTGVGAALLDHLQQRATAARCTSLDLDSGVQRHGAHRFYLRERFAITSHHFARPVGPDGADDG